MFYGVDFGANDALAIHGPDGPVQPPRLPRVTGGASTSDKFIRTLPILLETHDVAIESATVGASGVEPDEVAKITASAAHRLYTVSCRATKNFKKDHGLAWDKGARYTKEPPDPTLMEIHLQENVHATDAEIIYRIATEYPARLRLWELPTDRLQRLHTSVRPHDKRNYRGDVPDSYMQRFPAFETLPDELQRMLGNGYGTAKAEYSRAKAMPFAMAMEEPESVTRNGFEKVIGLHDHGYPSFYRRNTVTLMQAEGKRLANVSRFEEVSPQLRKEAWKTTRRNLRMLWHILSGE